jgi:hypothetical protein
LDSYQSLKFKIQEWVTKSRRNLYTLKRKTLEKLFLQLNHRASKALIVKGTTRKVALGVI